MNQAKKPVPVNVKVVTAILLCSLIPAFAMAGDDDKEQERVKSSGEVLKELLNADKGVPLNLLNKSACVVVLPSVKKAGFVVGGEYGRGVMSCRSGANFEGSWSAPIMMQSSGGSLGLQAGGEETDFVILVMNDKGAQAVLHGRAKLGADASVAAGPVGRDAEAATDATMNAEMLSYSRARGIFGGVSLEGTSLGPDSDANKKLYGQKVSGDEIFAGNVKAPASADLLLSTLAEKSPRK